MTKQHNSTKRRPNTSRKGIPRKKKKRHPNTRARNLHVRAWHPRQPECQTTRQHEFVALFEPAESKEKPFSSASVRSGLPVAFCARCYLSRLARKLSFVFLSERLGESVQASEARLSGRFHALPSFFEHFLLDIPPVMWDVFQPSAYSE